MLLDLQLAKAKRESHHGLLHYKRLPTLSRRIISAANNQCSVLPPRALISASSLAGLRLFFLAKIVGAMGIPASMQA